MTTTSLPPQDIDAFADALREEARAAGATLVAEFVEKRRDLLREEAEQARRPPTEADAQSPFLYTLR